MGRLVRGAMPAMYAILDAEAVERRGLELLEVARAFRAGGVELLQYRDKRATREEVVARARAIGEVFAGSGAVLILNDWPEGCVAAGWDGVHVGQGDRAVEEARAVVGAGRVVGVSTHTVAEVRAAEVTSADYVATGPVYATGSKADAEAVIGLEGVRAARDLTGKPLVGIGGISEGRAPMVLRAGADAVAVIGAMLGAGDAVEERVRAMRAACEGDGGTR